MIDRRIFLQLTGGAAAAGAGGVSAVADARTGAMIHAAAALVQVGEGVVSPLADPLRLLSERLALATDGRVSLTAMPSAGGAPPSAEPLVLACEDQFAEAEPTAMLLGGYPFAHGAAAFDFTTWLRGAGGQRLWDLAVARSGWKPLMVGALGGPDAYVWSSVPLRTERDLAGLRIAAPRASLKPLEAFGAVPQRAPGTTSDLLKSFEAGTIDVFETDDPALSLAAAEQLGGGIHAYCGSIGGTSRVLSLRLPLPLWERLPVADQVILEAVAQETVATLQAVRQAHRTAIVGQLVQMRGRRPRAFSMIIQRALGHTGAGLFPPGVREEPVFASALGTMTALVEPALQSDRMPPPAV
jgi:TRAP-type mannitol/chloroaromatic compound transport system substrate-binding protein